MAIVKPLQYRNIQVSNCQECPFCNIDNSFGYDGCNINIDIGTDKIASFQMPKNKVHKNCPLLGDIDAIFVSTKKIVS